MGVEVVGAETVRESDGLALSCRNALPRRRRSARPPLALSQALRGRAAAGARGPTPCVARRAPCSTRRRRRARLPRADRAGPRCPPPRRRGAAARRRPGRQHPADRQRRGAPRGGGQLMLRTMMKSKIHRATVTQADLHYVGSVTVDEDLLDAADLLPGELVHIVDVTNGARLETYTIAGARGSGVLGINGAAARLVHPGDLVILIAYAQLDDAEARTFRPHVVFVDAANAVTGTGTTPPRRLPAAVWSVATPSLGSLPGVSLPQRLAAPVPGWSTLRRRRRHRVRHRRADRRAAAARLGVRGLGHGGHQGHPHRRVHAVGAGRHRRGARPRRHPRPAPARHARRGRRALRRGGGAGARHRGPGRGARADRARHRLRPDRRRRAVADPGGRPPPRPDRARRR